MLRRRVHRASSSPPTATCRAASTTRRRPASRPSRSRRSWRSTRATTTRCSAPARCIIKEQRAELVKHHLWVLWTDYFKPPHFEKYPQLHQLFNDATKQAGAAGAQGHGRPGRRPEAARPDRRDRQDLLGDQEGLAGPISRSQHHDGHVAGPPSERPNDVPVVVSLIHELATYEREPDAVVATEDGLPRRAVRPMPNGVLPRRRGRHGEVVGFALWFLNFSTWLGTHGIYLEDLFVRPDARGDGHGKALLLTLARDRRASAATAGSSGRCSTGTSPRSASTSRSAPRRWTSGPSTASKAMR